jgi:hypothetical protein
MKESLNDKKKNNLFSLEIIENEKYWKIFLRGTIIGIFCGIAIAMLLMK